MIQIQLQPEIEAQLAAEAEVRGLALDRYIGKIVASRPIESASGPSVSQAITAIRALRKGNNMSSSEIRDLVHEGHKLST